MFPASSTRTAVVRRCSFSGSSSSTYVWKGSVGPVTVDVPTMAFRSAADVTMRRTEWLWPGYLPAGAFTLLNGRQGDGKGTIGADWMARFTTGSPMPDGYRGSRSTAPCCPWRMTPNARWCPGSWRPAAISPGLDP